MSATLRVKVGERWYTVEVGDVQASPVRVLVDGEPVDVEIDIESGRGVTDGATSQPAETPPTPPPPPSVSADSTVAASKRVTSPMPGVIVSVTVREGQQVAAGDEVCILEAMKMQQALRSDQTGTVQAVHVSAGQQVLDGDPILDLA